MNDFFYLKTIQCPMSIEIVIRSWTAFCPPLLTLKLLYKGISLRSIWMGRTIPANKGIVLRFTT